MPPLSLPDRVLTALPGPCGVEAGARVGVGVSGGVDSVTLLRVLHAAGVPVVALHVDHGLRPDAGADAAFVAALADSLGVTSGQRRVAVGAGNRAAAARRARYAALAAMAREAGCAAVAVAHTATDQAETVLMALVRGTGLAGLGGMPPRRRLDGGLPLVRPMLDATRADVEAHAQAEGWTWRDDPLNTAGVRGRLRHTVLPLLDAEGGPDTARRIAAAAAAARAARPGALVRAFERPGPALDVRLAVLPEATRHAVWAEALARWLPAARRSTALVARLDALLEAPAGRCVDASGVRACRTAEAVTLAPSTVQP